MTTAAKTMKATGFVDERGELHLDEPLEVPPGRVSVLIEYENTADDRRLISVGQVCDFFVKKAKRLEVVQEVLLVGENEASTEIWTVLSADRMDFEAHNPIYDIQSEVARSTDRPLVGFRVVNLQDFRYGDSAGNLPDGVKSLWKREYVTAD